MKKLVFFAVILCLGFTQNVQAQKIDSILDLSYDFYSSYDYEEAINAAEMAESIALDNGDTLGAHRARFYKEIAYQVKAGDKYDVRAIRNYINHFNKTNQKRQEARAFLHLARIYYYFGDVLNELQQYLAALNIYKELKDDFGVAAVYSDMSLMYYDQHDYNAAFKHIRMALAIDVETENPNRLHRDYNNLAIIFEHTGPVDSAIYYHNLALDYAYISGDKYDMGLTLSNLGNNYVTRGDYEKAEEALFKALAIREELGNYRGLAYTHNRLANLYVVTNKLNKAQYHAQQSLINAQQTHELKILRMAYQRLVDIYEQQNNVEKAYEYYKEADALQDSLRNEGNTREITKMVMRYQYEQQHFADSAANYANNLRIKNKYDRELLKKHNQRNISIISGFIFLLLAFGVYRRSRYIKKSKEQLQKEKDRSDELLLNILPHEVAEELKTTGTSEARDFDQVTVLFTDFKEFTETAQKLTAKELVNEINTCFRAFDEIMSEHGIEKIKTIGDAYMAAGGLHIPKHTSPADVVSAALSMQEFMKERKAKHKSAELPSFEMRVGIHTGPVVAGIVGVKKFQYDIWGDTVNTANRMETNGRVGKVNISNDTYELLKDNTQFNFETRGKISVKGKGEMQMWFVSKR